METSLLDMYAICGSIENAYGVFENMLHRDVTLWNKIITRFVQNGNIEEALKPFQKILEWDVISWNTIIDGYTHDGNCEEASNIFRKIKMEAVKSNLDKFTVFLLACAYLVALEQDKETHEVILRRGF